MSSNRKISLKLLDTFALSIDGVEVEQFHSSRDRVLLAYLAMQKGEPCARSELAQLIWQGYLLRSAQASLRSTLSRLRKQLNSVPGLFIVTRYAVRLNVHHPQFHCDVLHDTFSKESVLLPNFEFLDEGPLRDWLLRARNSVRQVEGGNTAILAEEPSHKGMEVVGNLPKRLIPLVGREQEWLRLTGLLASGGQRLIVLTGVGGVGKTSLAIAAARSMRDRFPDGVWFISLVGVSAVSSTQESLATQLITLMKRAPNPEESSIRQLLRQLSDRRLLLIIDGMDHLLHLTPLLNRLVDQTKYLRIIVTSRAPLSSKQATIIELYGLSMQTDAESAAALALFETVAKRLGYVIPKSDETMQLLKTLADALLIEPLAIQLLAAIGQHNTPAELLQRLPMQASASTPGFEQSSHAALFQTWQQLDAALQMCLMGSAIFYGSFSRRAARHVANATQEQLDRLVDLFLLQRQEGENEELRYSVHPLIGQFAQQKMDATLLEDSRRQHARYYLAEVAALEGELFGQTPQRVIRLLIEDLENVHAAWDFALTDRLWGAINRALTTMVAFYEQSGLYTEARSRISAAQDALSRQSDEFAKQLWLRLRVALLTFLPQTEALLPVVDELSQLVAEQQLPKLYALVTYQRAYLLIGVKANFEESINLLQHALMTAINLDDKQLTMKILGEQARYSMMLLRVDESARLGQKMLQLARETGNSKQEIIALESLSNTAYVQAQFRKSQTLLEEAFGIAKRLEHIGAKNELFLSLMAIWLETERLELPNSHTGIAFDLAYAADVTPHKIPKYNLLKALIHTQGGRFKQAKALLKPIETIRDALTFPLPLNLLLTQYMLCLFEERFAALLEVAEAYGQLSSTAYHALLTQLMRGRALVWLDRYDEAVDAIGSNPQAVIEMGDVHMGLEYAVVMLWAKWQMAGELSTDMSDTLTTFLTYLQENSEALCGMLDPVRACLYVMTILDKLGLTEDRDFVIQKAREWLQLCLATTDNLQIHTAFLNNIPSHVALRSID